MKKVIALLITVATLLGILSGCSSNGSSKKTTVTFWTQDTVAWQT